jgi:hypothetical protein
LYKVSTELERTLYSTNRQFGDEPELDPNNIEVFEKSLILILPRYARESKTYRLFNIPFEI